MVPEDRSPVNQGWPRFMYRGNCHGLHRGNCLCKVLAGVESSRLDGAPKRNRTSDLLIANQLVGEREGLDLK